MDGGKNFFVILTRTLLYTFLLAATSFLQRPPPTPFLLPLATTSMSSTAAFPVFVSYDAFCSASQVQTIKDFVKEVKTTNAALPGAHECSAPSKLTRASGLKLLDKYPSLAGSYLYNFVNSRPITQKPIPEVHQFSIVFQFLADQNLKENMLTAFAQLCLLVPAMKGKFYSKMTKTEVVGHLNRSPELWFTYQTILFQDMMRPAHAPAPTPEPTPASTTSDTKPKPNPNPNHLAKSAPPPSASSNSPPIVSPGPSTPRSEPIKSEDEYQSAKEGSDDDESGSESDEEEQEGEPSDHPRPVPQPIRDLHKATALQMVIYEHVSGKCHMQSKSTKRRCTKPCAANRAFCPTHALVIDRQ
jgi:hypothetical protein